MTHYCGADMRIIHVETGTNLYGGALQVLYLVRGLREQGIASTLICPKRSQVAQAAREYGMEVNTLNYRGELDPRLLIMLVNDARKGRGERSIIHAHSRRGADLWSALASKITGAPFIITRRVDNPESQASCLLKYGQAAKVVAISKAIVDILESQGVGREKIELIYSAVDISLYRPGGDRRWFRREFSLPPNAKVVGMVAQFIPRKGHHCLLKAAKAVVKKEPHVRFLFFGKGPLEQEIREKANMLGLGDACLFCGFRDDLPRILPCLDLLVHPATMEGLGVSLLQASACGIPIVATRAGGIPEVVRDRETGILCEPGDDEGIAYSLLKLLGDNALARRMGEEGRRMVEMEFSITRMVKQYAALYRSILASSKPQQDIS